MQQIVRSSAAPLAAELHRGAVVANALKTQPSFGEAIKGQQFGRFVLAPLGFLQGGRQLQGAAEIGSKATTGKASHLLAQPLPLQ